jgi:hypothetical protein
MIGFFKKLYHLPVVAFVFAAFFISMLAYDLKIDAIWRGPGFTPTITRSGSPSIYWSMIGFFSLVSVVFVVLTLWVLVLIWRRKHGKESQQNRSTECSRASSSGHER